MEVAYIPKIMSAHLAFLCSCVFCYCTHAHMHSRMVGMQEELYVLLQKQIF